LRWDKIRNKNLNIGFKFNKFQKSNAKNILDLPAFLVGVPFQVRLSVPIFLSEKNLKKVFPLQSLTWFFFEEFAV